MATATADPPKAKDDRRAKDSLSVEVADWVDQGEWAAAPAATRAGYLEVCADLLTRRKKLQIRKGIGADNTPLVPVKPSSRPDGAKGPPLQPHDEKSRSQKWLRASKGKRHVTLWWSHGWGRIMGAHARGVVRYCPLRDIVGMPDQELSKIKAAARKWWRDHTWPGGRAPKVVYVAGKKPAVISRRIQVGGGVEPPKVPKAPKVPKVPKVPKPPKPPKVPKPPKPEIPEVPEPPELTLSERLRGLVSATKRPSENRAIIADELLKHQAATTTRPIQMHGMSSPQDMYTLEFEELTFLFPPLKGGLNMDPVVASIRSILEHGLKIPPELSKHTRWIVLSDQDNNNDPYWRTKYANFTRSAATGGDGDVVGYKVPVAGDNLYHEMGHNLAHGIYGDTKPPASSDYMKAVASGEPVPTAYGRNSDDEDFAESVKMYVSAPNTLKLIAPRRYAAIDDLIGGSP